MPGRPVTAQAAPAGFALPGPPCDRETVAGWTRWRLTRHGFTPAPVVTIAEWRAMSPRSRQLHDLHRAATHASLAFQETPMSAAVARLLGARIQGNALKCTPATRAGVMISGGGYQGKTETACEVAAAFEDQWLALHGQLNPDAMAGTRDLHIPVAYAQTPVTATPKSICQAILGFYGAPAHYSWTLPQLVRSVRESLHDHGTKVLILDDITRLRMHREADQDALDLIRSLMGMHVTLVLIGVDIPGSGLLAEGRPGPRRGDGRGAGHADPAAVRPGRARPVPLRPPGRDQRLGRPPGRAGSPAAAAEVPARHAGRRRHARVPVPPHQRRRRPAGAPDRGRLRRRHRHRPRAAHHRAARRHRPHGERLGAGPRRR